jgi:excisionase family DNA binding protein
MQAFKEQQERVAYSVVEVAGFIGVSQRTVWQLVKDGELPHFRIGTRCLIPKTALERFIASRTQAGETPANS